MPSRLSCGVLALIVVGCAAREDRPPVAPAPATTEPAAVYAAVRQREERIRTLRARFAAELRNGETVRKADGVLLVKKPDRFRLRLMSFLGPTVLDYTSVAEHTRIELPLQGKHLVDGEVPADAAMSPGDLRQAFLRADAAFPGECTPQAEGGDVVIACRDQAGTVLRTIYVDASTRRVRQEVSYAGDRPLIVTQLTDYRLVDTVEMPFGIAITYPDRDLQVTIGVRSYELNPVLADGLFETSDGVGRAAGGS